MLRQAVILFLFFPWMRLIPESLLQPFFPDTVNRHPVGIPSAIASRTRPASARLLSPNGRLRPLMSEVSDIFSTNN
jgi:hypothetical protein